MPREKKDITRELGVLSRKLFSVRNLKDSCGYIEFYIGKRLADTFPAHDR